MTREGYAKIKGPCKFLQRSEISLIMPLLSSLQSSKVNWFQRFASSLAARWGSVKSHWPSSTALPLPTTASPGFTFLPLGNLTLFCLKIKITYNNLNRTSLHKWKKKKKRKKNEKRSSATASVMQHKNDKHLPITWSTSPKWFLITHLLNSSLKT